MIGRESVGKGSTGPHPVVETWDTWQQLLQVGHLFITGHIQWSTSGNVLAQMTVQGRCGRREKAILNMLIHWRLAQAGQSAETGSPGLVVSCRQVLQQVWVDVWIGKVKGTGEVVRHGSWATWQVVQRKFSCNRK